MPAILVEHAARLAMPAVTPAEQHNLERYGRSHAIRRQDWRRGRQDCALHLHLPPPSWDTPLLWGRLSSRPWPPLPTALSSTQNAPSVEQAARLAMPAVTPAEQHNLERYGRSHAIRRQDWRRGTQDCALHLHLPPPSWDTPLL